MTDPIVHLERRVRYIPQAIERTEAKLRRLYKEAADLGFDDLLRCESVDRALEIEVLEAKLEARNGRTSNAA